MENDKSLPGPAARVGQVCIGVSRMCGGGRARRFFSLALCAEEEAVQSDCSSHLCAK